MSWRWVAEEPRLAEAVAIRLAAAGITRNDPGLSSIRAWNCRAWLVAMGHVDAYMTPAGTSPAANREEI